jgi:hypothetical protein
MKKVFLLMLMATFLFSCTQNQPCQCADDVTEDANAVEPEGDVVDETPAAPETEGDN